MPLVKVRLLRIGRVASEFERQPTGLANAYQRIVTAGMTQAFHAFIQVAFVPSKLVLQGKDVFHFLFLGLGISVAPIAMRNAVTSTSFFGCVGRVIRDLQYSGELPGCQLTTGRVFFNANAADTITLPDSRAGTGFES